MRAPEHDGEFEHHVFGAGPQARDECYIGYYSPKAKGSSDCALGRATRDEELDVLGQE